MENTSINNTKRSVGIELLRIISALMIIIMHCIGHGGLGSSVPTNSISYGIYWGLFMFSRVSVNCFILISGYFFSTSHLKPGNLFKLFVRILFYSLLTLMISVLMKGQELSIFNIIKAITPISSYIYWYASCYFIMYLSVPLLKLVVRALGKKQFTTLLIVLVCVFSVWPTIIFWSKHTFIENGYSFLWFFILYLTAAYIKKFDIHIKSLYKCVLIYIGMSILSTFIRIAVINIAPDMTSLIDILGGYNTPWVYISSIAFFMIFKEMSFKSVRLEKIIIFIAASAFAIYLIHDSDFIRSVLWKTVDLTQWNTLILSLLYMFAVVIVIALAGIIIDTIYRKIYQLAHLNVFEKKLNDIRIFHLSDNP